jgi:thiol-disulfide isomerase/thioredoxin
MTNNSLAKAFLATALTLIVASPTQAVPTQFNQAVANYKARKYLKALQGFQQVAKKYPTDAQTQYYIALCYQGMNQVAQAKQHYAWVAQSSRDARLRGQAQLALSQLDHYAAVRSNSAAAPTAPPAPTGAVDNKPVSPTDDLDKIRAAAAELDKQKAAASKIKLAGKLKVYQFHTTSSPDAIKFAPIWDKVTATYRSKVDFEKLDAEQAQNLELVVKYGVKTYPTIVYTDGAGKVLNKEEGGLMTEAGFVSMLNGLLAASH